MTDQEHGHLLVQRDSGVATVTLNRPDARNALNMDLKRSLADTFAALADDPAVRCVVVTGAGAAFCAGGDVVEMELNDTPTHSRARLQLLLRDVFQPLAEMEKPTVAAVNGHAHGAGLSLALACDLIVAADTAVMSCAFMRIGLLPDCGALYFLPRRLPVSLVKDLVLTGRTFSAEEALEMRLINRVVPAGELRAEAQRLATQLAAGPTVALGLAKRLLDQSLHSTWSQMATLEALGQAVCYSTNDHLAARAAFAERSRPTFLGT
ncbi:MAG: enoyl-CoA hydratase [Mycobacteriales bacterium]